MKFVHRKHFAHGRGSWNVALISACRPRRNRLTAVKIYRTTIEARTDRVKPVEKMRTYFFELKSGIPRRDRVGLQFAQRSEAINHSKVLAMKLRNDPRVRDRSLYVVVMDESGAEVHREQVFS
jgi:hypothetical protein